MDAFAGFIVGGASNLTHDYISLFEICGKMWGPILIL